MGGPRPDDGWHEVKDGARLFFRNPRPIPQGILNVREFAGSPDIIPRVISAYEEARKYSLTNCDELKNLHRHNQT
jgi:sulfonate transport system substrate-binding protein